MGIAAAIPTPWGSVPVLAGGNLRGCDVEDRFGCGERRLVRSSRTLDPRLERGGREVPGRRGARGSRQIGRTVHQSDDEEDREDGANVDGWQGGTAGLGVTAHGLSP